MNKANIVVMGKTGAGKSTLINAVLRKKLAKVGIGQAQTLKNETYRAVVGSVRVELLDTVGLELDSSLNTKTIREIKNRLADLKLKSMINHANIDEVNMVWYCANANCNRFEKFEDEFIKEMMYDYEIPFMIVLTQCYNKRNSDQMKAEILKIFPEIPVETILAEEYDAGAVVIDAYGVKPLLKKTVTKFNEYKLNVLQEKLDQINAKEAEREEWINSCILSAKKIIEKKAKIAFGMGCAPGVSLVALQTQYTALCTEMISVFGLKVDENVVAEIAATWITGLVITPILIVPGLAGALARYLILESGQEFLDFIVSVVRNSSDEELSDSKVISKRLVDEINRRKTSKQEETIMARSGKGIQAEQNEQFFQDVDRMEEENNLPPVNIIVAGLAGVGKSTLLNAVFGEKVAETGIGRPVTPKAKEHKSEKIPIQIWDTAGFELSKDGKKTAETLNAVKKIIKDKSNSEDNFDRIHAIWYCVNSHHKRLQETEDDFIAELNGLGVPFVIVMTQCVSPKQNAIFEQRIKEILDTRKIYNLPVLQVLAADDEVENPVTGETFIIPAKGLNDLVELTINNIPDYLKESFIAAQKISKKDKHEIALKAIKDTIQEAGKNAWGYIPIANIFASNHYVKKLLLRIANIYNASILHPNDINAICHDTTSSLTMGSIKDFTAFKKNLNKELQDILNNIQVDSEFKDIDDLTTDRKIKLVIAIDGFRFMNVLEEIWDKESGEILNDIDRLIPRIKEGMKSRQKWIGGYQSQQK